MTDSVVFVILWIDQYRTHLMKINELNVIESVEPSRKQYKLKTIREEKVNKWSECCP